MADTEVAAQHMEQEDVHDIEEEHEGVEHGGEQEASASNACEGLPGLAGDTPSGGQPVIAKLLISNAAAGSVIGKVRGHLKQAVVVVRTQLWLTYRPCPTSTGWTNY